MHRNEFTDPFGCSSSGVGSGFDRPHISSDHNGDITTADLFLTDQSDSGSFDHGISGFDGSYEASRFHHTEGYFVIF